MYLDSLVRSRLPAAGALPGPGMGIVRSAASALQIKAVEGSILNMLRTLVSPGVVQADTDRRSPELSVTLGREWRFAKLRRHAVTIATVGITERLIYARRTPFVGRIIRELLLVYGIEVPRQVRIGRDLRMMHRGMGTVISANTCIGNRVRIYHQVTTGTTGDGASLPPIAVDIGDDVVLYPGAKVLGGTLVTRVGAGTVVLANAVLTHSTGDWEVWGGIPARKIKDRVR